MTKRYRNQLLIISDILYAAMDSGTEGAIISSISRRANLSHESAVEKCQKLVDGGLLETRIEGKKQYFVIAQKGIEFYRQIQKFTDVSMSNQLSDTMEYQLVS